MKPSSPPPFEQEKRLVTLLTFVLDDMRVALDVSSVERVYPLPRITPLPMAPQVVLGVVNVAGRVLAVADPRRRFRLATRKPTLNDKLLIARTSKRSIGLVVNDVEGLLQLARERLQLPEDISGAVHDRAIRGVAQLGDGMAVIFDLEEFLSLEEEATLELALEHHRQEGSADADR